MSNTLALTVGIVNEGPFKGRYVFFVHPDCQAEYKRDDELLATGRFHTCDDAFVDDDLGTLTRTEWTLELTNNQPSFHITSAPVLERKSTLRFYSAWEKANDIHDMQVSLGVGGHTPGVSSVYQEVVRNSKNHTTR